jgi:3-oxoacyl-[acyl-carrier protein] reductase
MNAIPEKDGVRSDNGGRLQDKVCVITGGGSGIGKSIALVAANEGATVIAWDYDKATAEAVAAEIGGNASAGRVDVTDEAEVDAGIAQVIERHGRLDVLFNVAGVGDNWTPLEALDRKIWTKVFETNVWGTAFVSSRAVQEMLRAGKGAIVNISSVASLVAGGGGVAYTASKGAISSMTRQMAFELASRGIRVNAVAPGATFTNMNETAHLIHGTDGLSPAGSALFARAVKDTQYNTPMDRFADPDEIARVAVFLGSDEASYVTGAVFVADGGLSIHC